MANYQAAISIFHTALALAKLREKTGQTALEILDIACEPWRGMDADVGGDSDCDHDQPFGKLLCEAFDPAGKWDEKGKLSDDEWRQYDARVYDPFIQRYGF